MKKKLVTLGLVFGMAVCSLTGCAKTDYTNDAKAILDFSEKASDITDEGTGDSADEMREYAKKLNKELDDLEVKTDEGKDLKDDYEEVIELTNEMADFMDDFTKNGNYDEDKMNSISDKMNSITSDVEKHQDDFYDACKDAGIDEDILDDLKDEFKDKDED